MTPELPMDTVYIIVIWIISVCSIQLCHITLWMVAKSCITNRMVFNPNKAMGSLPPLKQLVQDFAPFHRISTGWWFGTFFLFFHNIWDNPSQLTNIFQRGRNHQPEMICVPRETRIISRRDVALKTSSRFAAGGDFARFFPEEVVSSSVKHGFLGKHQGETCFCLQ